MNPLVRTILIQTVHKEFPPCTRGRPRYDPKKIVDAVALVLTSGMPWRCLKHVQDAPDWRTAHNTFTRWSRARVFEDAFRILLRLYRRRVRPACKHAALDSTYVKNIRGRDCIGRNPTDRGRHATKVSVIVDDTGIPLALAFFPGNTSDHRTIASTLKNMIDAPPRGTPIYADKGYDSRDARQTLRNAGFVARVFRRRFRTHRVAERRRNVVERFFAWVDCCRRLLVRHETNVHAFASMHCLAALRLVVRRFPIKGQQETN